MTTTEVATTVTGLRPRCESANIRTWIGFQQFMQLAQEAVLGWFRQRGDGPQRLFHEHGLGVRVVDSSVLLPKVLEVDDEVTAEVTRTGADMFLVRLTVGEGRDRVRVLRGKLRVALVPERHATARTGVPHDLLPFVAATSGPPTGSPSVSPPRPRGGVEPFGWEWEVRYFHCQYSDTVQHSAHVRAMEEVVDRFLQECGLSVPSLLAERGWIPVVSRARVTLLGDARMQDRIRTDFAVHDIVAGRAFDGRMDCWVDDGAGRRRVATGTVLHGYALSRGPVAGQLAELDDPTVRALLRRDVR